MTVARSEMYEGLLPHPEHLERFEQIYPGAAKILFDEMQSQSKHRQALENTVVAKNESRADRAQWLALVVLLAAILGGVVIAIVANPTAGATVVLGAFGSGALVWVLAGRTPPS